MGRYGEIRGDTGRFRLNRHASSSRHVHPHSPRLSRLRGPWLYAASLSSPPPRTRTPSSDPHRPSGTTSLAPTTRWADSPRAVPPCACAGTSRLLAAEASLTPLSGPPYPHNYRSTEHNIDVFATLLVAAISPPISPYLPPSPLQVFSLSRALNSSADAESAATFVRSMWGHSKQARATSEKLPHGRHTPLAERAAGPCRPSPSRPLAASATDALRRLSPSPASAPRLTTRLTAAGPRHVRHRHRRRSALRRHHPARRGGGGRAVLVAARGRGPVGGAQERLGHIRAAQPRQRAAASGWRLARARDARRFSARERAVQGRGGADRRRAAERRAPDLGPISARSPPPPRR